MPSLQEKLPHLPSEKIDDLERITEAILETQIPEIIILFGSHARGDFKGGKTHYPDGSTVVRVNDYDILVVIDQPRERKKTERFRLADYYCDNSERTRYTGASERIIRQKLHSLRLPVQAIVEQIGYINQLIEDQQFFYADIKREGIELYNSGQCELAEIPAEISPTVRREYAEEYFKIWFEQAEVFFENSNTMQQKAHLRSIYAKNTSFQLEQVAEMCYKCLLFVYTHYSPNEHSLFMLRDLLQEYEPRIETVFPLDTEEQERLFRKLHLAYIGGRYISSFTVTLEEIEYWVTEIEKLLSLTKRLCEEKIEALRLVEQKSKGK